MCVRACSWFLRSAVCFGSGGCDGGHSSGREAVLQSVGVRFHCPEPLAGGSGSNREWLGCELFLKMLQAFFLS